MNRICNIFFFFLVLILASCLEEGSSDEIEFQEKDLRSSVRSFSLPVSLWEEIEKTYSDSMVLDEYSESFDISKTNFEIPKKIVGFNVSIREKTPGLIRGRNVRLKFGRSGSLLDLRDYINADKEGSFYFKIELEQSPNLQKDGFKVFHLTNSKIKKIGKEVAGNGCDEFRDITSQYNKIFTGEGLLVSTTKARHISLLAGSFIFVLVTDQILYFNHLDITDSRYLNFLCRR